MPDDTTDDSPLVETAISLGPLPTTEPVSEPGLSGPDLAAVNVLPERSALLVVHHGPGAGSRYLLDADLTTAGRRPQSDIFLDDVTVSRKHAEFTRRQGQFFVRDVGSLNGTYVNGVRIEETALREGDKVQVGKYHLIFYPRPAT